MAWGRWGQTKSARGAGRMTSSNLRYQATITPTLGAELLTDGGFENWLDANDLTSWTEGPSGTSTVNREDTDKLTGNFACRMDVSAINDGVQIGPLAGVLTVGLWHVAELVAHISGSAGNVACGSSSTNGYNSVALTTAYAAYVNSFIGTTTGFFLRRHNTSAGKSIFMDSISLKQPVPSTTFGPAHATPTGDVIAEGFVTTPANIFGGWAINMDSLTNPKYGVYAVTDRINAYLIKIVNGTPTLYSTAITYGDHKKLGVYKTGTTYTLYYDGVQVGAPQTIADAGIIDNTLHAQFATSPLFVFGSSSIRPFDALPGSDGDFVVVFMPDTQFLSQDAPATFTTNTAWMVTNAATLKIAAVVGEGDIVDDSLDEQWVNADAAMDNLDTAELPYLLSVGNHDYEGGSPSSRDLTRFNVNFPTTRYSGHAWFEGGFYEAGHSENAYCLKTIYGRKYIFIALEFGPRQVVVDWADALLTTYADRDAIIVTHSYLYRDGTRTGTGDQYNPHDYGVAASDHDGEELWTDLVSNHSNIVWVQSGHDAEGTNAHRQDTVDGKIINQDLAAWHAAYGGYVRVVTFRPVTNQVEVKTYSPTLGTYVTDATNQFTVAYR
jgi:hypothetical protein